MIDEDMFNSAVREFLSNLGTDSSSYDGTGVFHLTMENSLCFGMEYGESGVVAFATRRYPDISNGLMLSALQICGSWQVDNQTLHTGIAESEELYFVLRLTGDSIGIDSIYKCYQSLSQLHETLVSENEL